MADDEHSVGCDEVVKQSGHVTGEGKEVNDDTAKKAAQKDAQEKARIKAEAAAAIILDEYYCTDDDCPDPEITISYSFGKAKCTDDTEKDPTTGKMRAVRKCKVRCNWKVILECVDRG